MGLPWSSLTVSAVRAHCPPQSGILHLHKDKTKPTPLPNSFSSNPEQGTRQANWGSGLTKKNCYSAFTLKIPSSCPVASLCLACVRLTKGRDWSALPPHHCALMPKEVRKGAELFSLSCCCLSFPSMPLLISSLHLTVAAWWLCCRGTFVGLFRGSLCCLPLHAPFSHPCLL